MNDPARRTAKTVLLASLMLGALAVRHDAHALNTRNNPYGNQNTTVIVGALGSNIVVLYKTDDLNCSFEVIGNETTGLSGDWQFNGGNGADYMLEVAPGQVLSVCDDVELTAPHYRGRFVTFYGFGGNDTLVGYTNTNLIGGPGNDTLISEYAGAFLSGGDGDDLLYTNSFDWPGAENVFGGAGNDCLFDANSSARTIDCGGQAGDRSNLANSTCPQLVSSCP